MGGLAFACLLGHSRERSGEGQRKIGDRKGYGEACLGEISCGGWWLHAGRHLGSLRRVGWASRAIHLSSRRTQTPEQRHNPLGWLQEGWPSALLDRPSRNGGRPAGANFLYACSRQAGGVGHVDGREIGNGRPIASHSAPSSPHTTSA